LDEVKDPDQELLEGNISGIHLSRLLGKLTGKKWGSLREIKVP